MKIIVLVKQVPDTKNITGDAMTPEGTVNRTALPAVFNLLYSSIIFSQL